MPVFFIFTLLGCSSLINWAFSEKFSIPPLRIVEFAGGGVKSQNSEIPD